MNAVEELEEVLFLDQAQPDTDGSSSTQQLLDELLGRFEEEDSPTFLALALTPEFCVDSDE
jgi:hypothetical protein